MRRALLSTKSYCTTWTLFFFCSSGQISRVHNGYLVDKAKTYLPFLHLSGLRVVLLRELCQNLLQSLEVCLQRRDNIFYSPLGKNTVDHPEALAVPRERLQRLQDSPKTL